MKRYLRTFLTLCISLMLIGVAVGVTITLGPESAMNPVGSDHTLYASVLTPEGLPVNSCPVSITVDSGPHAGLSGSGLTNQDGEFIWTYGGKAAGTDSISARAEFEGAILLSNMVTKVWTDGAVPEFPTAMVPLAILGGLAVVIILAKKE